MEISTFAPTWSRCPHNYVWLCARSLWWFLVNMVFDNFFFFLAKCYRCLKGLRRSITKARGRWGAKNKHLTTYVFRVIHPNQWMR